MAENNQDPTLFEGDLAANLTIIFGQEFTRAQFDKKRLDAFLSREDDFRSGLGELFEKCSRIAKFEHEKIESEGCCVCRQKPISDQVRILEECLRIKIGNLPEMGQLPEGAQDWFVIPDWRQFGSYHNAVCEMAISAKISVELLASNYIFPEASSYQFGGIIAGQLGSLYAGHSPRCAMEKIDETDQVYLDPFSVMAMLVTHPERFSGRSCLGIDLPGAHNFARSENGKTIEMTHSIVKSGSMLAMAFRRIDRAESTFGTASGWLPKGGM